MKSRTPPVAQQGWRRLEPNTQGWLTQAYERYANSHAELREASKRIAYDPACCFVCGETHHIGDYTVNNDRTETFRYCRGCAMKALELGAHVKLDAALEEPEDEEESYPLMPARHVTQEFPIDQQLVAQKRGAERLTGWHPLTYIGLTFLLCVALYALFVAGPPFVQNKYNDIAYQNPRISQTDVTTLSGAKLHLVLQNEAGSIVLIAEPMPINPATFKSVVVVKVLDASLVPTATSDGTTIFITVGQFLETVSVSKLLPAGTK